jgi:hypothetical protein
MCGRRPSRTLGLSPLPAAVSKSGPQGQLDAAPFTPEVVKVLTLVLPAAVPAPQAFGGGHHRTIGTQYQKANPAITAAFPITSAVGLPRPRANVTRKANARKQRGRW